MPYEIRDITTYYTPIIKLTHNTIEFLMNYIKLYMTSQIVSEWFGLYIVFPDESLENEHENENTMWIAEAHMQNIKEILETAKTAIRAFQNRDLNDSN